MGKAQTTVAIHQPNFLPHPAFFAKMAACDVFILLDTAQFPTENWVNRNQLLNGNGKSWVTVPVITSHRGIQRIGDVEIRQSTPWRRKLLRRIELEYRDAPWKEQMAPALAAILERQQRLLVDLTTELLAWVTDLLGITTTIVRAGALDAEGKTDAALDDATGRLIALTKAVGGTSYLSGPSGKKYLRESLFPRYDLELRYASYEVEPYDQRRTPFVPGLSMLDMLLWLGPEESRKRVARPSH
ncbi:MAG: WbqC family protein [Planctomycetaceae bacterium]|nr:WbqC family protein [Planctomycetaceae bacterium]